MALTELDRHNLRELDNLNQRGGRMLSVVDLVEANTMSLDMAAELASQMSSGVSLLTAAVPGGSGKTTVMAALLNFLPPGVRLVTVSDPSVLEREYDEPVCFLPHEIGSGPWFGYLWGRDVARLFEVAQDPHLLASCLHADTLGQMKDILCSSELGVPEPAFAQLDLALFMRVRQGLGGTMRRVSHLYEAAGDGGHRLRWRWDEGSDLHSSIEGEVADDGLRDPLLSVAEAKEMIAGLSDRGQRTLDVVREAFVDAAE